MNRTEMNEIKMSRENRIGFLHHSDITKIDELSDNLISCAGMSHNELCDAVIELYDSKQIKNKAASAIFEIIKTENTSYRTESHRMMNGQIFEYNEHHGAYVFMKKGSRREFNIMNHYL